MRTVESTFRALRSALDYARRVDEDQGHARPGAHVVLVTSPARPKGRRRPSPTSRPWGRGRSTGARHQLRLPPPRLHRYLGGTSNPQRLNVTEVPGVQLVTQVTENDGDNTPSEVIAAQRRLVQRAMDRFDVILLDTAPILTTNDAADLLGVADHVVLIVNASETKAEAAARALGTARAPGSRPARRHPRRRSRHPQRVGLLLRRRRPVSRTDRSAPAAKIVDLTEPEVTPVR